LKEPLQTGQERLNVDGEENRGSRVPLTNGELHLLVRRQAVEHETGGGAAMEGGNPLPQDEAKAHGLQNPVQPLQRHTVKSMEEIKAEQKARKVSAVQILCH
jgi:hypothetical protein